MFWLSVSAWSLNSKQLIVKNQNIVTVKMKQHGGSRKFNKNNRNSKTNKFQKHGVHKKKAADTSEVPRYIKNFKYSQRNKVCRVFSFCPVNFVVVN